MTHNCIRAAYHEAGHAVVASLYDIAIEYATIKISDDVGAHVFRSSAEFPDDVDDFVDVLLAGGEAQYEYAKTYDGNAKDLLQAVQALWYDATGGKLTQDAIAADVERIELFMSSEPVKARIAASVDRTRRLVHTYRHTIEAVAHALIQRTTLYRNDINKIIADPDSVPHCSFGWGMCVKCREDAHKKNRARKPGRSDAIQLPLF